MSLRPTATASAAVRHEHVVAIYAVEDQPIPYLVMEFVPGETLQKRLDDHGPLDLPDALRIGRQIAEGLAAAHAEQLIHRDIKPGNVLLETSVNDHVRITDFGLARTADDASVTQSGLIAGTPMYMAPEQAQGQKLDQRVDLFSFGSVLYQMLSGRPPFRAPSTVAVLKRVAEDTPRPIPEIIPEVPEWMCEIVRHLHAKNPDERYTSAKEVAELLLRCLEDLNACRVPENVAPVRAADEPGEREAPVSRPVEEKPAFPRSLTRVAAAAVLLLVCLGVTEATGVTRLASTVIRLATGYSTSAERLGNGQRVDSVVAKVKRDTNQRAEFTWRHEDVHHGDDYPVAQLSWKDAAAFCEWLSGKEGRRYRLPTEAEWEWACRAGNLHDFHFENDPGQVGEYVWHAENSESQTHPVGLKKPNPWGLFDMLGNVCEYCLDWHAKFPRSQLIDPRGPNDGQLKVVRGGGYIAPPDALTLRKRGTFAPSGSLNHFGFRVVCEVVPDSYVAVKAGLAPGSPPRLRRLPPRGRRS